MPTSRSRVAITVALSFMLVLFQLGGAEAQGRKSLKAATGPFTYEPAVAGSATFLGASGGPDYAADYWVTAPAGGAIFPSGGLTALAEIRVFGIEKVADADGVPLTEPMKIPLDSDLGMQIAGAFWLDPWSYEFAPGDSIPCDVLVSNPLVDSWAYGHYVVTMKAQAIGSGIGVGSGARFHLNLLAATDTDTTPPTVTIDDPADSSTKILGNIDVRIRANDPAPGSGVASMSATISSAGGTVNNEALELADDAPQPAGSDATATGTYTPTGGSGLAGTTEAGAFAGASRSGIGTYTISATATDADGNVGVASSTFQVKYSVEFLVQAGSINTGNPGNSNGHFKFTANRSATPSGVFIYDKTVVVELRKSSDDSLVATHVFGSLAGGANSNVVFTADPAYETRFRRGDIGASGSDTYYGRLLFVDVDGNPVQQAQSNNVTF